MFIINSKCLLCDGGLSPGSCCDITELDWNPYIQEDCRVYCKKIEGKFLNHYSLNTHCISPKVSAISVGRTLAE